MNFRDALLAEVLAAARLPNSTARQNVAAEIEAHMDDLAEEAKQSGHAGDSVDRYVRDRFGSPDEVGRAFAHVYAIERLKLYAWVGLTVGPVLTAVASVLVYAIQRWLASLLDARPMLSLRHFSFEAMLIAAAVGIYIALSMGNHARKRDVIYFCLVGIGTLLILGISNWLFPAFGRVAILGLFFALAMRAGESIGNTWRVRIVATSLGIAIASVLMATAVMAGSSRPMAFTIPMWLVLGFSTSAAARCAGALGTSIVERRLAV